MIKSNYLTILQAEEFREMKKPHEKEFLRSIGSIRYCKAEVYRECIFGTLRIPEKNEKRTPQIACGFYLTENELFLVECSGDLKRWIEKKEDKLQNLESPDQFLLQMMELMIENDILYLSHLEKEMEKRGLKSKTMKLLWKKKKNMRN